MKILSTRSLFLLCGLATLLFVTSCKKDPDPVPPVLEEEQIEDLAYGEDERHRMDVYLPEGRDEKTPVILFLHGGFWMSGDKEDFTAIQQQLLANGIASINMNYRYVGPNNNYTGLLADVGQALALAKNKAAEWGVRGEGFHLAGASAGGYMALMYAYTAKKPNEIRSVVSIAGPVGFTAQLLTDPASIGQLMEPVQWLVGAPIPTGEADPSLSEYLRASPISHVQTALPTLLIHGTADELVPFVMSEEMKAELDAADVDNQLVPLEGGKHNFSTNPIHVLSALNALTAWVAVQEGR